MPLVEAIPGKGRNLVPERQGLTGTEACASRRRPLAAGHKAILERGHLLGLKFAHPLAQPVGLRPREPGNLDGYAQNLFLEEHHPRVRPKIGSNAGCR